MDKKNYKIFFLIMAMCENKLTCSAMKPKIKWHALQWNQREKIKIEENTIKWNNCRYWILLDHEALKQLERLKKLKC